MRIRFSPQASLTHFFMLILSILSLLLSNAVTLRRDMSILFNRVSMMALIYCILNDIMSLSMINKGLGLHGGLLHISNITQMFHIFIFFISILILQLTSFYPKIINKMPNKKYFWLEDLKKTFEKFFFNKIGEHMKIIEYPLILLFVISGAVFLISTNDLVSIFLSIELQSYGLYLLSTIYRNSELSTTGGLIYFLLGAVGCGTPLYLCLLLPNSGDALKIMVLNNIRKNICGWINYSGIVTSHNMKETEIGNRGSKSVVESNLTTVKEQRVNGNIFGILKMSYIRCTLIGFERNYWVGIPSKQIKQQLRFYTLIPQGSPLDVNLSNDNLLKLNPWWVTGFVDGEGYFSIGVSKNKNKVGWQVKLEFGISIHKKDIAILEQIQKYFSAGQIFLHPTQKIANYRILFKDLDKILKHFDQYPLITQKLADLELFRLAYTLVLNKEHLSLEGLQKIVAIKGSMNKGLSDQLQAAFKGGIIPISRPLIENKVISNIDWLAGFTTAEGCFFVNIQKSATTKSGVNIQLEFNLSQHKRDERLLVSLVEFFGCGNTYTRGNICRFRVTNLTDIITKIIPIFKENPTIGAKFKDFEDFCLVAEMLKDKKHLTPEGLDKVCKIKARMNTGRVQL